MGNPASLVDLRGRALAVDVAGQGNLAGTRATSPRITEIEGASSKTAALGHAGTVSKVSSMVISASLSAADGVSGLAATAQMTWPSHA